MRSIHLPLLVGGCLALSALAALGAELPAPRLLADLVPGVSTVPPSNPPRPLAAAGARMLFQVDLPEGTELWSSDGTAHGAERVLPIDGGTIRAAWEGADTVDLLVEHSVGASLLRTDGTAAGTVPVATWPDATLVGWFGRSERRSWVAPCYDGADDAYLCELWTVDDTTSAVQRLASDLAFEHACVDEQPTVGERLFFFTDDEGGSRLWRSDGTAATTVPIAQLPAGQPCWAGRGGGRVFFDVDPEGRGTQVWTSDGTGEGTRVALHFPTPTYSPWWVWVERDAGPFFYATYDAATRAQGVWAVGAAGRVRRLASFAAVEGPIEPVGAGPAPRYLFAAARRPPAEGERPRLRLWVTDGTPGGTMELRGLAGGPAPLERLRVEHLQVERLLGVADGRLYFAASDGTTGVEPWTSDGTAAGTRRIADTCPGPCGSQLGGVVSLAGTALFVSERVGEQTLWRSDGTSASPVASLDGGSTFLGYDAQGDPLGPVAGGRVYFSVSGIDGFALWASDGTAAGTGRVDPGFTAPLGSAPWPLAVSAEAQLFAAVDPLDPERRRLYLQRHGEPLPAGVALPDSVHPTAGVLDDERRLALFLGGSQLWATDGTAGGTVQLTAFGSALRAGDKSHDDCYDSTGPPQRAGDRWYFSAYVCREGEQLWSTDGSLAGTQRMPLPDEASAVVLVGGAVFFLAPAPADDGTVERQLFRTTVDGGEAVQLTARAGGGLSTFAARWAAPALGRLFFNVGNVGYGDAPELWVSDGTAAGTGAVTVGPEGAALSDVRRVVAGPGFALAWTGPSADTQQHTLLGISPASRVATRLAEVGVGEPSYALEWTASADEVFFAGWDPQHGGEVWISDGTPAGTRLLDLVPGPASSNPHDFAASDAGVFFAAHAFESGEELWLADGGGAAARLVADLAPGRVSSAPSGLVAGPGRLLFTADDGATGREPWILDWGAASAAAATDGGAR